MQNKPATVTEPVAKCHRWLVKRLEKRKMDARIWEASGCGDSFC
jgi:hypothetical protein